MKFVKLIAVLKYIIYSLKKKNNNGIINEEFNKNHKANLINICEDCHNNIHKEDSEYVIKKTLRGRI